METSTAAPSLSMSTSTKPRFSSDYIFIYYKTRNAYQNSERKKNTLPITKVAKVTAVAAAAVVTTTTTTT